MSIDIKEVIRKSLKSRINIKYTIKQVSKSAVDMEKILFIEIIKTLKEIEDRTDFMESELGVSLVAYEDKFFKVIDNLFKLHFNKEQVALIQMYVYQLSPDKEWDGKITVKVKAEEKTFSFSTPEQVWDVLKNFED